MTIRYQDGASKYWSSPEIIHEIVWFVGHSWGYAHRAKAINGTTCIGSITKHEASMAQSRPWVDVQPSLFKPREREVIASTGG